MSKESLSHLDKRVIFRETFNSFDDVARNGGASTNLALSNGLANLDGTAYIEYNKRLVGTYTIRLKLKSFTTGNYFCDFRVGGGTGYFWISGGDQITGSSGTEYVNGVAAQTLAIGVPAEVALTGITISCNDFVAFARNVLSDGFLTADVDLLEIYEGTLTAEEISALYKDSLYTPPSITGEVLSIDPRQGSIVDKWGNAITNTAVTVVKDDVNIMEFIGTPANLNIDSALTSLATTTVGTWKLWIKVPTIKPASTTEIVCFGDTNANEYIVIQNDPADGKLNLQYAAAGTVYFNIKTSAAAFKAGVWHHVCVVQDGTLPIIYIDGVAVAQSSTVATDTTKWFAGATGLDNGRIGCLNYNSGGNQLYFKGKIGELSIINTNWSAQEVAASFNSQKRYYNE